MATGTTEDIRRAVYELAEALAPGWERHRADIEETLTPVRSWMLRELAPCPGQTLLELAAGAGDTGFEAAAAVGPTGRGCRAPRSAPWRADAQAAAAAARNSCGLTPRRRLNAELRAKGLP